MATFRSSSVVAVSFAVLGCSGPAAHRPSPPAPASSAAASSAAVDPSPAADADVNESTRKFSLSVSIRSNLFHLLLNWALLNSGKAPPWTPDIAERDAGLDTFSPEARRAFEQALQVFGERTVGRDITFDAGLHAVRAHAAGALARNLVPEDDRVLIDAIENALPFYRERWWSAHRAQNVAWIQAMVGTLSQVEQEMTTGLANAYGGNWPTSRVPIDVVVHAVPNGAYSAAGRVTLSSTRSGYEMPWSIEMVLHESSHLSELEPNLRTNIGAAFRAEGKELPERLWHDIIFYTSAVMTDLALTRLDPGTPYRHYGEATGLYERGKDRWQPMRPILDQTWGPFVRSGASDARSREAALRSFARRLPDQTRKE